VLQEAVGFSDDGVVVENNFTTPAELQGERPPSGAAAEFSTDFSIHSISYSEVLSGGPNKDGIPAVDTPVFVGVDEGNGWLRPQEPVVVVRINQEARAYPLQILTWHEIVNDEIDGVPVTVTFCPLCNTAIAFHRAFDGQVLDFGTTGRLRYSNLIMYDRQTETWWQQATGTALAGLYTGSQLAFLPAPIIAWADFAAAYPGGMVLSRETGYTRRYGSNPYAGYDDVNSFPFLFDGPLKEGLAPMARVLTIDLDGSAAAYPYEILEIERVVNDTVGSTGGGTHVAVFWFPGTASALDKGELAAGRDVGTANSFLREVDSQVLTFQYIGGEIRDEQTGSAWSVLGEALDGPLAGRQLTPVVSVNHFWFSWGAFRPDTRVYGVDALGELPDFPNERPTPAPPEGSK